MSKIMLIDDDESLRELVGQIAAREGWDYCCSDNGAAGLEMLRRERPDVLVLDVMLPDMNGFDVCRLIRSEGRRVPVVFLSAKGDIVDKSVGFNSGADDYLVKPFLTEELVLRVKVWLNRRARAAAATDARAKGSFRVGDLEVFFKKYEARLRGEAVALSSREFELLELLASEAGTVFTREQIIDALWEHREAADPNTVTVLVRKIREKIEDDPSKPRYVLTVWRVGYKLADRLELGA